MKNTLMFELAAHQAEENLRRNVTVSRYGATGINWTTFRHPHFDVGYGASLLALYQAKIPMTRREIQRAIDKNEGSNPNTYNTLRTAGLIEVVWTKGNSKRKHKAYALTGFGEAYIAAWLADLKIKLSILKA